MGATGGSLPLSPLVATITGGRDAIALLLPAAAATQARLAARRAARERRRVVQLGATHEQLPLERLQSRWSSKQ